MPHATHPGRTGRRGSTLLETCAALSLCSAAAAVAVGGARPLVCAARVETARLAVVDALVEARRRAYAGEVAAAVRVEAGASMLRVDPPGEQRPLGADVVITRAPADGRIDFHASGLADNATVALSCGAATATVVVNQRGVIR